ncbi:MAG: tRNA 2-thiocytidine(32) synthetase TtcA [Lachnospiraceae bacterium]|nr:tRNA 2-thiocytidine(32) synthetase TtcA [Lachnospiraceae bacterium]
MNHQQLYSKTRQAIDDYHMIDAGDRIAVGLSGGKDSLALLYALHGLQSFYPIPFSIVAVTVDLGFEGQDYSELITLCRQLDIPYHIIPTQIAEIVFKARQEDHPCSLCSRLRKGALNQKILDLQCNKLSYAHHRDDVVDTMMLSLIYEGRWNTLSPVTYLDRTGLTLIRPLIYVKEADIKGWIKAYDLPVQPSKCPADKNSKRETVKEMLRMIGREAPGVRNRMFTAIQQSGMENWDKK